MKNIMKRTHPHIPPTTVKRISVIFVEALRGTDGSKENPLRSIHLYYDDNGEVLACYDPINGEPDSFFSNTIVKGTVVGSTEGRIPFFVLQNKNKNAPIEISTGNQRVKILRHDVPMLISILKDYLKGK